jgi:hypothetical protein
VRLRADVLSFLDAVVDYKEQEIDFEQLRISSGFDYCGERLSETGILSDRRLIILSIKKKDGELMFNPDPDTILEIEDTLIAIGDRQVLSRVGAIQQRLRSSRRVDIPNSRGPLCNKASRGVRAFSKFFRPSSDGKSEFKYDAKRAEGRFRNLLDERYPAFSLTRPLVKGRLMRCLDPTLS